MSFSMSLLLGIPLLVQVQFALGLRPEEFRRVLADDEQAEGTKRKQYCCFDSSAGRNDCFNDVCFKPKKADYKCPKECCSGSDCPPAWLEVAEVKAETERKQYCCFDSLSGRNDCFNDVCFKPKKADYKCPKECCSGSDCPPAWLEVARVKAETERKQYCCFDSLSGRNDCFNDVCFKPKKADYKCPKECCSGSDCPPAWLEVARVKAETERKQYCCFDSSAGRNDCFNDVCFKPKKADYKCPKECCSGSDCPPAWLEVAEVKAETERKQYCCFDSSAGRNDCFNDVCFKPKKADYKCPKECCSGSDCPPAWLEVARVKAETERKQYCCFDSSAGRNDCFNDVCFKPKKADYKCPKECCSGSDCPPAWLEVAEVKAETERKQYCCFDSSAGRNDCFNDVCFKPKKADYKCPKECCSGSDCPPAWLEVARVKAETERKQYCCFDSSAGRNDCFNDVCFKPKKADYKCPKECCSGSDCPPAWLEVAEVKAETERKQYCCFDSLSGRNDCFNDVCFKPKKADYKCPKECCSGSDCPPAWLEVARVKAETERKQYCCFDSLAGRNDCFNDVCFKPKKADYKCPKECCSGSDCPPAWLEVAEVKAETERKQYCCFDSLAGRNDCFNDVCFKPKKADYKCPQECA